MGIQRRTKDGDGLTERQSKFVMLYPEKLNIYRTADECGIPRGNIVRDIKKDTPFGREVRRISAELDGDPRFSKIGTLSALYDMEDSIQSDPELEPRDKYRLLLDIRKEINKMIDGNIASQKKFVETKTVTFEGVYDLTQVNGGMPEPKTIEISSYDEAED